MKIKLEHNGKVYLSNEELEVPFIAKKTILFEGCLYATSFRPQINFPEKVKDLNATIEFKYSCNKNNFIGLDDENKLYRITLEEL